MEYIMFMLRTLAFVKSIEELCISIIILCSRLLIDKLYINFWNWNSPIFTKSFLKIQQLHILQDNGYWPVRRIKAVKYLH